MRKLLFVGVLCALAGCADANKITVTYNCVPSGAMLVQNGRTVGVCPMALEYQVGPHFFEAAQINTQGVTAHWASGATASSSPTIMLTTVNTPFQVVTLSRPANAPDVEKDLHASAEFERNVALRNQAQAQYDQAYASQFFVGYAIGQAFTARAAAAPANTNVKSPAPLPPNLPSGCPGGSTKPWDGPAYTTPCK